MSEKVVYWYSQNCFVQQNVTVDKEYIMSETDLLLYIEQFCKTKCDYRQKYLMSETDMLLYIEPFVQQSMTIDKEYLISCRDRGLLLYIEQFVQHSANIDIEYLIYSAK